MAVVSKVPTDVLTEIFYLLCKESIFVCRLNNSCWKEDFPWAVGLVCRQWRTAFLSYPPIWASLKFSDRLSTRSYAKEINRRLALYLARSRGYPLRLDILLSWDHNKSFTMIALKMLSACSHRWQSAKIGLSRDWQVDSILPCKGKLPTLERLEIRTLHLHQDVRGIFEVAPRLTHAYIKPWATHYGILPWTQLTELTLTLAGDYVIDNGDISNLLPMLHNIKELHFRFDCYKIDFERSFPEFVPTPLNQLRVLEVPYPAMLSCFEAPSLSDLYFVDRQQDYDKPLDVHEQISSLIQRSGCTIRKISFQTGRKFDVGTLKDVEELVIDRTYSIETCFSIDISSLPNLRFLTIICWIDEELESSMKSLTTALQSARVMTRNECSSDTPVSLLERVTVELKYDQEQPNIPKSILEMADKWPVVFRIQRP